MKKTQFIRPLFLLAVIGCGMDENRNSKQVTLENMSSRSANEPESLGVDGKFASVALRVSPMTPQELQSKEIDSYIRFKQANGVECSGVVSYEPTSNGSGMVDVFLYTALHCLQETNALGVLKNSSPKISESFVYRMGGLGNGSVTLTTPNKTVLVDDARVIHVLHNGQDKADVARIWQFRAPLAEVSAKLIPVCTNRLSDSKSEEVAALGFYIEKGNQFELIPSPSSWHKIADEFQHKLISSVIAEVNPKTEMLNSRLKQFFGAGTKVGVSPYLLKLGATSSQPGESGSPVYSVSTVLQNSLQFSSSILKTDGINQEKFKRVGTYNCLTGILARELAQRAQNAPAGAPALVYDTYFSPFRDASDRRWVSFDGTKDLTQTFAPPADLLASRTFNTLAKVHISRNPLGITEDFDVLVGSKLAASMSNSGILTTASQVIPSSIAAPKPTIETKTINSNQNNVNVETLFGSSVYKSNSAKVVVINSSVVISSTSSKSPALLIPSGAGGSITIKNSGKIIGKGGSAGTDGGDALHVRSPAIVENTGTIAGGGGGGGNGGNGGRGGNGGLSGFTGSAGVGGAGGAGGTGGAGEDTQPALSGEKGKTGAQGTLLGGTRGGTGGTGGQGGAGGKLGMNGSAGQSGGVGGKGADGTRTKGSAGSAGSSAGAGGLAGFAIQGTKLTSGRLKVGSLCQTVVSQMGTLLGRQGDTVNATDFSNSKCQ